MKKVFLLMLVSSSIFFSCKPDSEVTNTEIPDCKRDDTGWFWAENQHTRTIIYKIYTYGTGGGLSKSFEIEPNSRIKVTIKSGNYAFSATYKGESSNFSGGTCNVRQCEEGATYYP